MKLRGNIYHLSKYIIETEPEMAKDYFERFESAFKEIPFDEGTKLYWNQLLSAFSFFTKAVSILNVLKGI